jgi:hypothetical protein
MPPSPPQKGGDPPWNPQSTKAALQLYQDAKPLLERTKVPTYLKDVWDEMLPKLRKSSGLPYTSASLATCLLHMCIHIRSSHCMHATSEECYLHTHG